MEKTLPKILREMAKKYPEVPAQYSKNKEGKFVPVLYSDYYSIVLNFGAGLLSLGIKRYDHIGLISDNRKEWAQADLGLLSIGAIDVPRGSDATESDLRFILAAAECKTTIAENNAQVKKILALKEDLPLLTRLICLDELNDESKQLSSEKKVEILCFKDILSLGEEYRKTHLNEIESELDKGTEDDLACIIFTSGTTGEPKGVMLQHKNFIVQLDELQERIYLNPGDKILCVLPIWHAFQRLCEYVCLCQAGALCYSKPVGSVLLGDLATLNPQIMPAVPRVFEAVYDGINRAMRKTGGLVYGLFKFFTAVAKIQCRISRRLFRRTARFKNDHLILSWIVLFIPWLILLPIKALGSVLVFSKIRAKLGNSFRGGVSGGGALPPAIDEFFWAAGVNIVEGYGLTETAPVVAVRPFKKPTFGTVGSAIRGVEIRILDEKGEVLPPGNKGVVQVRGGIVMKGYYNKPELTAKVIDKDGWFDTGDIGMMTVNNELVLRGRMKDTIVLRGGENVEPLPMEMKLNESRFISQAMVVGQDQRVLGALIIPVSEEIMIYARENYIPYDKYNDLLKRPEIKKLIETEIYALINAKSGFKMFERISCFVLLEKPFEVGKELSAKQEIKRFKITEIYETEIKEMFKSF